MPHVTPGNRLYLYQLFVREVGVGKQTMLSRIEEVLLADDIMPCDMGLEDVRSLLEELSDFVRLTVFRKGRAYATIIAQPEWDEILAQLDKPREESKEKGSNKGANKGGAKSWKRKKSRKSPKPAKPRPHGRPVAEPEEDAQAEDVAASEVAATEEVVPKEAPQQEATTPETAAPEAEPVREQREQAKAGEPTIAAEQTGVPSVEQEPTTPAERDHAPEPEAFESGTDSANEPEPELSPEPEESEEPETDHVQPVRQFVHLSVVSEPDPEPEIEFELEFEPTPILEPPLPEETPSEPPLPHHVATEVNCGNEQLSILYQLLPFDVDPIALLDEDWCHARSVEDYEVDGATITFFLRYLHRPNGTRVPVRMRRGATTTTGKRWTLVSVGDENLDLAEIGFDGLPLAEQEAWRELATHRMGEANAASPVRELAHYAHLGPWGDLLSTLADLAAPESWGSQHEALREYLGLTFHRIRTEDKIAAWDDRSAFDTGLFTPELTPIYMVFEDKEPNDRMFSGFVTTCDGPVPQPAAYVRDLGDMTLVHPVNLRFARPLENAYPSSLQAAAQASVDRTLRDYRLCVPAYDPIADVTRLLLPLALDPDGTDEPGGIDHALVLTRTDDGYLATAVLPLDRAAICARVVTSELPSWLR